MTPLQLVTTPCMRTPWIRFILPRSLVFVSRRPLLTLAPFHFRGEHQRAAGAFAFRFRDNAQLSPRTLWRFGGQKMRYRAWWHRARLTFGFLFLPTSRRPVRTRCIRCRQVRICWPISRGLSPWPDFARAHGRGANFAARQLPSDRIFALVLPRLLPKLTRCELAIIIVLMIL